MEFLKDMEKLFDKERTDTLNDEKLNFSKEYINYVFDKTIEWAEAMEEKINKLHKSYKDITNELFTDIASKTLEKIDNGMSAFQYGLIVSLLNRYWEYGEMLRIWHNSSYGVTSDGVVNPAILVCETK